MTKFAMKAFGLGIAVGTAFTLTMGSSAQAQIFSDNSITYSYGTQFREPFTKGKIEKHWVNFFHIDGDKYGGNLFALTTKMSDANDPTSNSFFTNPNSLVGSQELYAVYIREFSYNKLTGSKGGFGPIADFGWTVGGHANAKNNIFGSEKRLLTTGVYMDWAMPKGVNFKTSFEACREWNRSGLTPNALADYHTGLCINSSLGVPFMLASVPMRLGASYGIVGPKGEGTVTEHYVWGELMADAGAALGAKKGLMEVGVRYDYWVNKFGNNAKADPTGGSFERVPMLQVRSHF